MNTSTESDSFDVNGLFEDAGCGLLVTDASGRIRRVNHLFAHSIGYEPGQLLEQRFQNLLTVGCQIYHQTHWLPLLHMQGSVMEVQLELVHRDRRTIPVLVNAIRRERRGEVLHHLAVFVANDRRKYEQELRVARKRAEELLGSERSAHAARNIAESTLRLALDAAQLLVWRIDLASCTRIYEPGVRRLIGLAEAQPLSADLYQACIHPDDRAAEQAALNAALTGSGSGIYAAEYRLIGVDGVERVVSSSGQAFFDDRAQLTEFTGVLQDVTGWRRAEQVLREQEREAQARAVLAEQLIGIVSHDLRTPLNAVLLGADALAITAVKPAEARIVQLVRMAARRATRLIGDLLDFTQARLGGGLRVAPRTIDLHELVAACTDEIRIAWPQRLIEHRSLGDARGDADPDRLAQIVTNLANNALSYGAGNSPVIITSRAERGVLVLELHNEGPPIPEDLLPHLFEPMRRGEHNTRPGSRSIGLGLYIVQQIVTAHRGQITVRSTADEGTTFTVRLPDARR